MNNIAVEVTVDTKRAVEIITWVRKNSWWLRFFPGVRFLLVEFAMSTVHTSGINAAVAESKK